MGGLSQGFPGFMLGSMSERVMFDTHRFVQDLVAAGMAEAIAETLAEKQVELLTSEWATRVGVAQGKATLKAALAATNERIAQGKANLRSEVAETQVKVAQAEANLKTELASTKTSLIKWVVTIMTACTRPRLRASPLASRLKPREGLT